MRSRDSILAENPHAVIALDKADKNKSLVSLVLTMAQMTGFIELFMCITLTKAFFSSCPRPGSKRVCTSMAKVNFDYS